MAIFSYNKKSAECGDKTIYLCFAVGAAGAVGAFTRRCGFTQSPAAAVLGTAGQYTLNLDQKWQGQLSASINVIGAVANTDGFHCEITSSNLTAAQPNVVIQFRRNSDMAAANPPNPSQVCVTLVLKDSTV